MDALGVTSFFFGCKSIGSEGPGFMTASFSFPRDMTIYVRWADSAQRVQHTTTHYMFRDYVLQGFLVHCWPGWFFHQNMVWFFFSFSFLGGRRGILYAFIGLFMEKRGAKSGKSRCYDMEEEEEEKGNGNDETGNQLWEFKKRRRRGRREKRGATPYLCSSLVWTTYLITCVFSFVDNMFLHSLGEREEEAGCKTWWSCSI